MYVYANCDASVIENGARIILHRGDTWDAADPFVKLRPDLFEPDPPFVHRTVPAVEQATAAPGERRGGRRGA